MRDRGRKNLIFRVNEVLILGFKLLLRELGNLSTAHSEHRAFREAKEVNEEAWSERERKIAAPPIRPKYGWKRSNLNRLDPSEPPAFVEGVYAR